MLSSISKAFGLLTLSFSIWKHCKLFVCLFVLGLVCWWNMLEQLEEHCWLAQTVLRWWSSWISRNDYVILVSRSLSILELKFGHEIIGQTVVQDLAKQINCKIHCRLHFSLSLASLCWTFAFTLNFYFFPCFSFFLFSVGLLFNIVSLPPSLLTICESCQS